MPSRKSTHNHSELVVNWRSEGCRGVPHFSKEAAPLAAEFPCKVSRGLRNFILITAFFLFTWERYFRKTEEDNEERPAKRLRPSEPPFAIFARFRNFCKFSEFLQISSIFASFRNFCTFLQFLQVLAISLQIIAKISHIFCCIFFFFFFGKHARIIKVFYPQQSQKIPRSFSRRTVFS